MKAIKGYEELSYIFENPDFDSLMEKVNRKYNEGTVYPPKELIFNSLLLTPFDKIKAVIIGQDPYINEGQAMGLSFSVPDGTKFPPSLKNIFTEYHDDLGFDIPTSGNLTNWAKNGILLLNTVLTVDAGVSMSHKKIGWEKFTDSLIKGISEKKEHVVFILWGNYAMKKAELINTEKHCIINSAHPSPLSCYNGFFSSKPFSKINSYLTENNIEPINFHL